MTKLEHIQGYDGIAEWYDQCVRARTMLHDTVIDTLSSLADEVSGLDLCDLACRQGLVARGWPNEEQRACVGSISLQSCWPSHARRREPLGIVYVHEDVQSLSSFSDGVLCNLARVDYHA